MAEKHLNDQGKLAFVEEVLRENAFANATVVNEAWRSAGNAGTISRSSVGKVRQRLGLTGNNPRAAAPTRARIETEIPRAQPAPAVVSATSAVADRENGVLAWSAAPRVAEAERARVLGELEADFDHLMFRIMTLGGLADVEEALRRARRALILRNES